MIGNKIMKVLQNSEQNNLEIPIYIYNTFIYDKELPKEIYISPEERQKNIDNLRLNTIVQ